MFSPKHMKYYRRGNWFLVDQDEQKRVVGRILFQRSQRCLSLVQNEMGNVIGVFDILDSTFKPVKEDTYYKTGCDPF